MHSFSSQNKFYREFCYTHLAEVVMNSTNILLRNIAFILLFLDRRFKTIERVKLVLQENTVYPIKHQHSNKCLLQLFSQMNVKNHKIPDIELSDR